MAEKGIITLMAGLSLFVGLLFVLTSAFLGGFLAKKARQPLILGYLVAGILVSGLLKAIGLEKNSLSLLAEIGLGLLMFTLGLEFSLGKIRKQGAVGLWGAGIQILLTSVIGTLILMYFFTMDFRTAFVASASFSLSSTAIVVKILSEKNQLESASGEIMVGWLLVQDLAVFPLLSLLPVLFGSAGLWVNLLTMSKAVAVLLVVWFSGQSLVPRVVDFVAKEKSRELLIIFVVSLVFVFALLTSSFGFSFGLGAFLAGLILGHSESHFAVFSEIRPLRDLFLAVFFVSLGLSLDPSFLLNNIGRILFISLGVLITKTIFSGSILVFFKQHAKTVLQGSFGLSQAGEFAFVIAASALAWNYIDKEAFSLIVSVSLLTMVFTPWLFTIADKLYLSFLGRADRFPYINKRFFAQDPQANRFEELPFANHVVILGYGRVGKWVGMALEEADIPYLVVEFNPRIVKQLKLEGKRVVFGDPTDIGVLDLAQVDKAKLVIIAIPDPLVQKMVVANCQTLNPRTKIVCRSHLEEEKENLKAMGVEHVIQPEFEAALSISHRTMQFFGFDREEVLEKLKKIKKQHDQ